LGGFLRHIEILDGHVPDRTVYPYSIPALRTFERLNFHPSVTYLIGENGSGKSTIVEAIAIKAGFNPEGGTKNFRTTTRPSESTLHRSLRLARGVSREKGGFFLRAETMFNVATEAEAYAQYEWETLHEMSHGEAFIWVVENRFRRDGLFVLDEPEAALSPMRQLACLSEIHRLVGFGGQFVIATHSPILMAYPDAAIYYLDGNSAPRGVDFRQTEHFAIMKAFVDDPAGLVAKAIHRTHKTRFEG
jgi:predicted ATPase